MLEDVQGGSAVPGNAATGGAAETGTQTGIVVSFDTWGGNSLPDGPDIEGIIVRVDNKTVGRFSMPARHGAVDDITSLQTGPIGGSDAAPDGERGDPSILDWAPLEVDLDDVGVLNVTYKNSKLIDDFNTGFYPSPGQIILMGRTGGANEVHHVDNLTLKTELADGWLFAGLDGSANGFTFSFRNVDDSQVDPDSIIILLDGVDVSDEIEITNDGDFTRATYHGDTLFPSASTHVVNVTASGNDDHSSSLTAEFTTETYTLVSSLHALEAVDTSANGFLLFIKQKDAALANNTLTRLDHLADDSENVADDFGSDNYTWTVDLINFDQDGNPQGKFRDSGNGDSMDVPDDYIPGIPGFTDSTDNITAFIQTVARIPEAGFYTFGFNSDDGFLTTVGNDLASQVRIGEFSGGRGSSTTEYSAYFEAAGDYAMQSLWYEGGGDASLEWFTITPDKALLNDTANGGIETFAALPSVPARVISMFPRDGAGSVSPDADISVVIEDATQSVDVDSVTLAIDGIDSGASATKNAGTTTITVTNPEIWAAGQQVSATLAYAAGGVDRSVSWNWTVVSYPTLEKGITPVNTCLLYTSPSPRDRG